MRTARYLTLAGGALAALVAHMTVVQPLRLRVHDVPLAVPGWPAELDGLRVAVVGDVHVGSPWFSLDAGAPDRPARGGRALPTSS